MRRPIDHPGHDYVGTDQDPTVIYADLFSKPELIGIEEANTRAKRSFRRGLGVGFLLAVLARIIDYNLVG
jgi:hypothetical protein